MEGVTLGPYELNKIYTGDARELAEQIPDNSVDLIFTDPVYNQIDDYRWLAETAARVLKPDSACLVWSNGKWHRINANWLESGGLTYRWDFGQICRNGPAPMNGFIIAKTNRLIWLDKAATSKMIGYLADGYQTIPWSQPGKEWQWTKDPNFTGRAIQAFIQPSDVVADFFCGGGTVPAVAKMLGVNYWACEIDPATAELARQRVAMTQPPLFVVQPEQLEMVG